MNKKYFYAAYILLALIALIGGGIGINICQEHKIQYWIAYGLLLFSFVLNIDYIKNIRERNLFGWHLRHLLGFLYLL
ncbi:hypothetical protein [Mannheimia indoligenes]|uniref:hypothetical protein n=1 Tax=Mannheimia indoligenes TaxID=3103145 RepID=UPI002FE594FC